MSNKRLVTPTDLIEVVVDHSIRLLPIPGKQGLAG